VPQARFPEASYYLWRSKFGGMDVSDAKRLKALEARCAYDIDTRAAATLNNRRRTLKATVAIPYKSATEVSRRFLRFTSLSRFWSSRAFDSPRLCRHALIELENKKRRIERKKRRDDGWKTL
jgi:hypothetical protein